MPFARCSDLDRLLSCYGGAVLGGEDAKSESTKEAADWGTMVHHWKETGEVVAVNGRKNLVPLFHRKLEKTKVRREQWWPEGAVSERALAIDPELRLYFCKTDGTREEKEAWKASHNNRFITGTNDADWWLFDRLYIDDLKTGRLVSWEDYQHQVTAYALGVAGVLGYRGPVHVTLTHWPRYPVHSQPQRFGKVLEWDEVVAFEKRLVLLRDSIMRAREDRNSLALRSGEHCTFCRSRSICPEFDRRANDHDF